MVTGMNVDVGTSVGETTVGMDVFVGRMIVCCPQADSVKSRIIMNKGFIELRLRFTAKDKFCKN